MRGRERRRYCARGLAGTHGDVRGTATTAFERPRYFPGKLVTAADFELEQRYHIEKRRLLNRMLHGPGVVSGLGVSVGAAGAVTVEPGFALDPYGREILVCDSVQVAIPDCAEPVSICLLYTEAETESGTVRETYELIAATVPLPEEAVVLSVIDPDGV